MKLASRRITTAVGAIIDGVDLQQALSPEAVRFIGQNLAENGVVFFREQELSDEQMNAFVSHFGTPIPEPFGAGMAGHRSPVGQANMVVGKRATAVWHTDTTFVEAPPGLTALRAVKLPPVGGDTLWASMFAAYDALSSPMKAMLDKLTAVHTMTGTVERLGEFWKSRAATNAQANGSEHVHPMVVVQPETGRKALFISEAGMTRIVELEPAESAHILAFLFEHVKSPDFAMRWRWTPNDVALWDNRIVQHYAVPDYEGERIMQRVVLAGDKPCGPHEVL